MVVVVSVSMRKRVGAGENGGRASAKHARAEVKLMVCGCTDEVRRAWSDYNRILPSARCCCASVRLQREVQRHHYRARRDAAGQSAPDVDASNRFAAYAAISATTWIDGGHFRHP